MPEYERLIRQIAERSGVVFRPASPFDLSKLEALGLPERVLEFYASFEPNECVEGQVRLWPIEHILEENKSLEPGCYASKHGYFVFATTFCGDAYCFDNSLTDGSDPRIVLLSHEVVNDRSTAADLDRLAKPVARTLSQFLEQFIRGEIDEQCVYG
jgi:hypothetical protein